MSTFREINLQLSINQLQMRDTNRLVNQLDALLSKPHKIKRHDVAFLIDNADNNLRTLLADKKHPPADCRRLHRTTVRGLKRILNKHFK